MKKNRLYIFTPLLLFTISVTSCGNAINPLIIHTEQGVDKMKAKYIYKDYYSNSVYNDYSFGEMSCSPSLGESHILVIPIWFNDSSNYILEQNKENVRDDIRKAYFGSSEETGWESVASYYKKDSFNRLEMKGTVSEWYEINRSSSYYYSDSTGKVDSLVANAVNWYKKNHPEDDIHNYDYDQDGYIDGFVLIYAAPDYITMNNNEASNLWAYTSWTMTKTNINKVPVANTFFWASYDFMYDEATALKRAGTSYGRGKCEFVSVDSHTFIHETGHVLGLEDYYDYNNYNNTIPAGSFSMQDYNVGAHDPYSRLALGWVEPYVPTKTKTFDVKPSEEGEFVLLSDKYTGSPFDEYILLELYTPTGLNKMDAEHPYRDVFTGLQEPGVRVWHVDARLYHFTNAYRGNLTTKPSDGSVLHATSNTSPRSQQARSYAGSGYYNLLQLIRNDEYESYINYDDITDDRLFHTGDTFSLAKYKNQFFNSGHLNDTKRSFSWTVTFNSVTSEGMNITVTKK